VGGRDQANVRLIPLSKMMMLITRSDLLSTFHTKRTPIIKVHHTPRNMVMAGGSYIPPSSTSSGIDGHD
jgi:hypothetical protein